MTKMRVLNVLNTNKCVYRYSQLDGQCGVKKFVSLCTHPDRVIEKLWCPEHGDFPEVCPLTIHGDQSCPVSVFDMLPPEGSFVDCCYNCTLLRDGEGCKYCSDSKFVVPLNYHCKNHVRDCERDSGFVLGVYLPRRRYNHEPESEICVWG